MYSFLSVMKTAIKNNLIEQRREEHAISFNERNVNSCERESVCGGAIQHQ